MARGAEVDYATWKAVFIRDGGRCRYCGQDILGSLSLFRSVNSIDHIIPLSAMGTNDLDNVVLACHACNWAIGKGKEHEWNFEARKAKALIWRRKHLASWQKWVEQLRPQSLVGLKAKLTELGTKFRDPEHELIDCWSPYEQEAEELVFNYGKTSHVQFTCSRTQTLIKMSEMEFSGALDEDDGFFVDGVEPSDELIASNALLEEQKRQLFDIYKYALNSETDDFCSDMPSDFRELVQHWNSCFHPES